MNIAELYFRPKNWEKSGRLYRYFGIVWYKKFILILGKRVGGQTPTKPGNYFIWNKSIQGLKEFEKKTRYNEIMHLIGIIIPIFALLKIDRIDFLGVILIIIALLNFHPYILQRYNRSRINRILPKESYYK